MRKRRVLRGRELVASSRGSRRAGKRNCECMYSEFFLCSVGVITRCERGSFLFAWSDLVWSGLCYPAEAGGPVFFVVAGVVLQILEPRLGSGWIYSALLSSSIYDHSDRYDAMVIVG